MRNTTVAFRGSEQVVTAYRMNDMPSWALCSGKELMFAHEALNLEDGESMLRELLLKLEGGGSRAIFTLRVYELKKGEKILSSTPYNRSFNFLLWDEENGLYDPFARGRRHAESEANDRIQALELQIESLKTQLAEAQAQEEEEEPDGIGAMISGVLTMLPPEMKQAILARAIGFVNEKIFPMNNNSRPGQVAGIPGTLADNAPPSILTPDEQAKAQAAINILAGHDPQFGTHLTKLAKICVENPAWYKSLAGMLK